MEPIIFIGGVGSHQETIAPVVTALENHYKRPVRGFTFREAQTKHLDLTGAHVITHSAGLLLVAGHMPSSVLAITPPINMNLLSLVIKFFQKDHQLIASQRTSSSERTERIKKFYRYSIVENSLHPMKNIFMAPQIAHFNSLTEATILANKGVKVVLGFGSYDFLFRPENEQLAVLDNVASISNLPGQHDELLLEPEIVLERLYVF